MKYSTLLEQFIMPFANDFSDTPYYEDMFEFAITAWNLGNMMVLMPLKDSEEAIKTVHDMSINRELMKKLIDYKASHFKEYTNFIVDFEFKETNADPVLTVVTQEQETFLDMMLNEIKDEECEDEFQENFINRCAIIECIW